MDSVWKKTYIAIDLKSFYASVECVERGLDPLTANLVVADSSRTDKTICLAVTPSLKELGLSSRCRLFEVVQKALEFRRMTGRTLEYITAVPRMSLYIKYSADIYGIYLDYFSVDDIHVYSIDEVFIDVTDYLALYKVSAEELVRRVVKDIYAKTGITATAGIAPNLFLCKVAMDIIAKHMKAESNGLRIAVLDELSFRKQLWAHKPLTDFWRIGRGTAGRLEKYGMRTLGDIARRSLSPEGERSLYKIFGVDAEILIDHAWGYEPCSIKDIKRHRSGSSSCGAGQVLSCAYTAEKARLIVKEMTESLVLELVDKTLAARSFSLYIGYEAVKNGGDNYIGSFSTDRYGRIVPKGASAVAKFQDFTSSVSRIMPAVLCEFDRIINKALLVKRVNICANDVITQENDVPDLFMDYEKLEKERRLQQTVLQIKKKYGKNAVLKCMDYEEGATAAERNCQIGGHRA